MILGPNDIRQRKNFLARQDRAGILLATSFSKVSHLDTMEELFHKMSGESYHHHHYHYRIFASAFEICLRHRRREWQEVSLGSSFECAVVVRL